MEYWTTYTIILVIGLVPGIAILTSIRRWWKGSSLWKSVIQNTTISLLSIFITFMALEIFFAFFAQTDNLNFTLASKNWFKRYWSVNSLGYRDIEWSLEKLENKRKVIVLGDSFAAGYGIKNIDNRFANILGEKLGNNYAVILVAERGTETRGEIKRIQAYPYKPDILILQYYINDIEDAARAKDVSYYAPKLYPSSPILQLLVTNSYVFNFIYWRTARLGASGWASDYSQWIKEVYNDPNIWWLHQQELLTIYNGALAENIELVVVTFPALTDVEGTKPLTDKVVDFFEQRGVPTLDVADLVKGMPPEELVVSRFDSHANEWLHRQVADNLYEMLIQLEASKR